MSSNTVHASEELKLYLRANQRKMQVPYYLRTRNRKCNNKKKNYCFFSQDSVLSFQPQPWNSLCWNEE